MKFSFFTALFVFFLLPHVLFAQSNYLPATIVNVHGDTVHGFIDYREWSNNPLAFSLKKNTSDKAAVKITPAEAQSVNINDLETFVSYTGQISMDFIDVNYISTGRDTSYKPGTFFLKVIQKGKNVNFYSYTDAVKTRLFVQQNDDHIIYELGYRLYRTGESGQAVSEETFKKQLFALADKYDVQTETLVFQLEKSEYNVESVLPVISKINYYTKKNAQKGKNLQGKSGSAIGIGVGLNISNTQAGARYQINGGTDYTSFLPKVYFIYNAFANANTRKLVFSAELSVEGIHYQSTFYDKVSPYYTITYKYTDVVFGVTPQVIYNFYSTQEFKVYLGAGVVLAYNNYTGKQFSSPQGEIGNAFDPFRFSGFNTLLKAKAGFLIYNTIGLSFAYIQKTPVSNDPYFQLNNGSMQIGIEYFLGKNK